MNEKQTRIITCTEVASKSSASARVVRVEQKYPEILQAIRSAYRELLNASISSGKKSMEEWAREELLRLTGRSMGRINNMLVHTEYLSDECLARLCELGADEDFFDALQKVKQGLVKSMKSKGLGLEEIEREISGVLPEIFLEYERKERINRKRWLKMSNEEPVKCNTWSEGRETFGKPQILKYRPPNADGQDLKPLEERKILGRLKGIAGEIGKVAQRSRDRRCDLVQEIGSLLIKMSDLHHAVLERGISTGEETDHGTIH